MTDPTPKAPVQICGNCHYFRLKLLGTEAEGKCHRYPPTVSVVDLRGVTVTYWPGPKQNEYCGEWKPRLRIAGESTN